MGSKALLEENSKEAALAQALKDIEKKFGDGSVMLTYFLSQYLPGHKNVSSHTIAAYRDTFKLFLTYCETCKKLAPERITMARLTKELVLGFLDWIETERGCSIPARNHRLAVIHSFCRFTQKEFPEPL